MTTNDTGATASASNAQQGASLPYRASAGIMLINSDGLVWAGKRIPKWQDDRSAHIWQMPQGGIDDGESPDCAAIRELEEETGVRNAVILAESRQWLQYDLPIELQGVALKGKYRGQKQKWFAMRFLGEDREIDISARNGLKAEFDDWRWQRASELPGLIVPFKRKIYQTLIEEFSQFLS